jgi:hypothetical protein
LCDAVSIQFKAQQQIKNKQGVEECNKKKKKEACFFFVLAAGLGLIQFVRRNVSARECALSSFTFI